ncbi:SdiA-regulated domain-containing protein [candidate division CSSED10-310 bacterium]|uniref:SdiA-regulated domain-containing protein n=1 Tax=candidate division CSSED10-310 bacterium TaxID=2855610 RepID=A0ABV6YZZ8_UNCC1
MNWTFKKVSLPLSITLSLILVLFPEYQPAFGLASNPLKIIFPYQWIGNIDQSNFEEPSGIIFHPGLGTLFVVGDDGDIGEFTTKGKLLRQKRISEADFEGITVNPATKLLYLAVEGDEKIIEIEPRDLTVQREFVIDRVFQGRTILKKGGQGIEAITFIPNPKHPEGGTFFLSNQSFKYNNSEDPSVIIEVSVPLRSTARTGKNGPFIARILRTFNINVIDISGMHYDNLRALIYFISDATNTFFSMMTNGKIINSYAFPGDDQEGITVDDQGFLYFVQDSGGLIKLRWHR